MATFKKKTVAVERVAAVEDAASMAPIVGDPRMAPPVATVSPLRAGEVGSSQEPARYEIGRTYEVPVGKIKSNSVNPRAIYTASSVSEMAESLAARGQGQAASAYQDEAGDLVLIDGERRLRGARTAGLPTLRLEIRPKPASERELYEEARAANVERKDQSPLDDAIKWKELISRKIYPTQAALAKALKLGEDHVSRTLSLAQLPSKIVQAAAEYPELLSLKMLNAIREFWEVKGEEETLDLISEAAKSGMGYRDVAARRKAAAKGTVRRPRSTREQLTFRGAKGEFKSFEEDGRIELKLKGLAPDVAAEISEKILALFPKE
ncbi:MULTISPECIES: ParB/RepB/Spo0J family partition protein [Burkholderia]|jgi:ParB family transcriptional regulator, chromosome partitioning protein|uniref:ParB/RepB/Spo0J family partition protein n=1 Tax=Burkholderia cenocepacia TaxID=95486 RepID=A0ABD4UG83_9BURK|nr:MULTISPECIES: ParB/RepB/Spo0J family partition protein [Burkholderia]TCW75520.1 ParB/RepB/Spo0J family partition protein [Burkholderia sp. SRS-46]KWH59353.1 chromosome partitioning protein ParB [Burkholderia cepacia]MCV9915023.1 ParB/RepB/Spo0J family partition protein [Burkholderia pseudomallei]MCW0071061.1 ParB/RepB/Spo0J family partition protein [Burkholderia pseudomallei]MCW3696802.1 ParB/RepB/Spo0J family partition protein [Burkholderia cenocepacia]